MEQATIAFDQAEDQRLSAAMRPQGQTGRPSYGCHHRLLLSESAGEGERTGLARAPPGGSKIAARPLQLRERSDL